MLVTGDAKTFQFEISDLRLGVIILWLTFWSGMILEGNLCDA